MFFQCIAPICTIAAIVLAILLMTRTIYLEDALKQIGKVLFLILLVYVAVCILTPPIRAGVIALRELFSIVVRWLLVAVFVIVLVMLLVRLLQRRFAAHSKANGTRD